MWEGLVSHMTMVFDTEYVCAANRVVGSCQGLELMSAQLSHLQPTKRVGNGLHVISHIAALRIASLATLAVRIAEEMPYCSAFLNQVQVKGQDKWQLWCNQETRQKSRKL